MKLSIITVCLNAESTIEKSIQSIVSQTYPDIEYIIIDGESSDRTLDIVGQYSYKISKVISEKDNGIYDAMNKGISNATGDVIYFLNADDRLYDTSVIEDIAEYFQSDQNTSLLYGTTIRENMPPTETAQGLGNESHAVKTLHDLYAYNVCHQGLFARKSVFDSVGFFDCNYSVRADLEWIARCWTKGLTINNFERKVAFYNCVGFNYQNRKQGLKEKHSIFRKYFSPLKVTRVLLKEAIRKLFLNLKPKQ